MQFQFEAEANQDFLKDKKVAIIVANFYPDIGQKLLDAACLTLKKYAIEDFNIDVFYAPGAFEVPTLAKHLAEKNYYAGIITLGAVIRGETSHFDFICQTAADGISRVSSDHKIPIGFGILTCENMSQTRSRAGGKKGNKGVEATMAMVEMLYLLKS